MVQMREAPLLGIATLAVLAQTAFASEAWKTGQGMTESTNDAVVENVTAPPSAPRRRVRGGEEEQAEVEHGRRVSKEIDRREFDAPR